MKETYNKLLAQKLIAAFEKRGIEGFYCKTKEDALQKALSMPDKGDVVSSGGSQTLREIGFHDTMRSGYHYLDPINAQGAAAKERVAHAALSADYYFMSANAISETGEIVNIDGIGNRTAALMFGPKHVVIVAGLNKIAPDLEAAIKRAKTYAARLCLMQFKKDYASLEELSAAAELGGSHLVVTGRSVLPGRVKVILVGEDLGA